MNDSIPVYISTSNRQLYYDNNSDQVSIPLIDYSTLTMHPTLVVNETNKDTIDNNVYQEEHIVDTETSYKCYKDTKCWKGLTVVVFLGIVLFGLIVIFAIK